MTELQNLMRERHTDRAASPIRSVRDWCQRYTPRRHAAKECGCYPKPEGRIYIIPRPGVNR